MWNAYRHCLCAGGSLQQARRSCQGVQVSFVCLCPYLHSFTNVLLYSVIAVFDFRVKKQAQDRPMSLWLSSIKQLDPVRHLLSPLLLDFMEAAWPSSISMVIPRGRCILGMFANMSLPHCTCEHHIGFVSYTGPWMDTFGLGDAAKHIGTPQSIAIRNPDCSVATHLINLVWDVDMNHCIFQWMKLDSRPLRDFRCRWGPSL